MRLPRLRFTVRRLMIAVVLVAIVLALRLREIREEFFAGEGLDGFASMLGLPCRTWENYERGVTIPGEVPLRFLDLTGVNPLWLLHGIGEKFRLSSV